MPDETTVIDNLSVATTGTKRPEVGVTSHAGDPAPTPSGAPVFSIRDLDFFYGAYRALRSVSFDVWANQVTALIGPSGCGKSTLLRCFNRMNDLIPGTQSDRHA